MFSLFLPGSGERNGAFQKGRVQKLCEENAYRGSKI